MSRAARPYAGCYVDIAAATYCCWYARLITLLRVTHDTRGYATYELHTLRCRYERCGRCCRRHTCYTLIIERLRCRQLAAITLRTAINTLTLRHGGHICYYTIVYALPLHI